MARSFRFYDFNNAKKIIWHSVAFPDGDSNQIPAVPGLYRFILRCGDDNQTLFADIAPSLYGKSLRACFIAHCSNCEDECSDLKELYGADNLEFEHHACSEKKAINHKAFIIANYKPHYNIILELRISDISEKDPFEN